MARTMKSLAKRAIIGSRLEPVARWMWRKATRQVSDDRNAIYDRQAFEVMRRVVEPTSCCVDVGAARGLFLRQIIALSPKGRHYAFEPLPHLARRLRESFPAVEIMQMALAEAPGRVPFRHVIGEEGYSGFFRRPYDTYEERVEMIEVEVRRLDEALPEDVRPRFIKVDVEGSEARVFQGGAATLARSHPFVAFESGWDPEASYDVLAGTAGLQISLLESWLSDGSVLSRDQFLEEALSGRNYFFLAHPPRA